MRREAVVIVIDGGVSSSVGLTTIGVGPVTSVGRLSLIVAGGAADKAVAAALPAGTTAAAAWFIAPVCGLHVAGVCVCRSADGMAINPWFPTDLIFFFFASGLGVFEYSV